MNIPPSPNKLNLGFHTPFQTQFNSENYNAFLYKNRNRLSGGFKMASSISENKSSIRKNCSIRLNENSLDQEDDIV